jgi:hypothetical protein
MTDMTCCPTESTPDERGKSEIFANEFSDQRCAGCEAQGRPVSRKTVLLMLKQHLLEEAMAGTYSFCSAADCPVVYFEERGVHTFTAEDLRVPVGVKASADPVPLCYCFGFDESHVRDEVARTGHTNIPERISRLIREGFCACESRNPAGICCLGEVKRAVKRIQAEEKNLEDLTSP